MTQTGDNAGAQASPQPIARPTPPTRRSRAPWLALGLAVAVAAVATVWQRWSDLAPAAPPATAPPAQAEPPGPPRPVDESVQAQPQAAVAEAAPRTAPPDREEERNVYEGFRVRLDVWAADEENDPLTYEWVQTGGPNVKIHDADKPHAYFMAGEPGRYVFAIRVGDGKDTTMAQVVRTVTDADLASRSPGKE